MLAPCCVASWVFDWTMMKRWKKSFGKHVLATTNFYQIHWLLKIHFEPHCNFLWFWSFLKMMFLVSCLLAILPGQVYWDLWRVRFQVVSRWCWTLSRLDWVSGFTKRYIVTEYESPQREVFHHTRKPSLTLTLNCALIAWNIKCVNWKSIREQKDDRSLTWSLPEWSCWFSSDGPQEWCQAQPAGWGRGARPG